MASAKDRLRVLENVMGNGGNIWDYFKALSTLNGLQTYSEMNPPISPITPNVSNPTPLDQNQGAMPPLGDGGLNTPQNTSSGMV